MTQLEIMPKPPEQENKALTWPNWPLKLRTSSSQAEGAARDFSVATQPLPAARTARSRSSNCVRLDGQLKPMPGTEFQLARQTSCCSPMGFLHPVQEGMVKDLGLDLDPRGNVKANRARLPHLAR